MIKSIDVNETDEYGYTGLHLAAEHGHLKVVEELMVRQLCGGKIYLENIIFKQYQAGGAKLDPLVFDSYYLPVHLAINKVGLRRKRKILKFITNVQGHTEIAKKLINAGCKINELIYVINSKMFNDAKIFVYRNV